MADFFHHLRPIIHLLPPETVHRLGLAALRSHLIPAARTAHHPALQTTAFGLTFKNPIGLAAGFDKNAVAINGLLRQGFGFVEAGTVTPKAQHGNPMPRIFRLTEDEAVINRLGFNNAGIQAYIRNFAQRNRVLGIAGANIGKNKDSTDATADYVICMQAVYALADYITVNISSPNTQGLRDLQKRGALDNLLATLMQVRRQSAALHGKQVPLLVKVAPDLTAQEMEDIAASALTHAVDGLIVSNTTVSRPSALISSKAKEQGGLSGKPLFALSTETLKTFYRLTGGKIPLVGVGGIASPVDAYAKIRAGATLVQLYTALVYQGFGVVRTVEEGLVALLARDGFSHISEAVGADLR